MRKITLSICKVYKSGRRFSKHRKRTKKAWKHYYLQEDEPDEYNFETEWVDSITAQFLKLKKLHKRWFICVGCHQWFYSYVKNARATPECPYCEEE